MHKFFKNQTRYKLDKEQLNQEGTHKSDKQENCPNYIQKPKSTHDWGNQKGDTKRKVISNNKQNPSKLFMMAHKVPRRKNVCLPNRHVIGIKYQLKITNVHKHIG